MKSRPTLSAACLVSAALLIGQAPVASTAAVAADSFAHPDPELDLTAVYQSFTKNAGFERDRIETRFAATRAALGKLRILVVPSWLSDTARAAAQTGLFDFLGDQVKMLEGAGITVEVAATDSEGALADNAPVILKQIARSQEPVCLISHSKGGLDSLEALLRAEPATLAKIRCWIALQSPFAGSPLADFAADSWLLREAAGQLLPALGGSAQSLFDLTVAERRRYLAEKAVRIERVLGRVRVLCYAGLLDEVSLETLPTGIGTRILSWAADRNLPSDGLVPVESAILPGTHHIVARGVDHALTNTDQLLLIKLLLSLVINLPENPPLKA